MRAGWGPIMSKAFTRESDDEPNTPRLPRPISPLPPGAKNYLTGGGAHKLREELKRLEQERLQLTSTRSQADVNSQLQRLDQRLQYLRQSLQSAVVVPHPPQPWDRVRFGATVTVRDRSDAESQYRIVGVDETDLDRNWVSWLSPIAKALMNAALGQSVSFSFPTGEEHLQIVAISYEADD